MKEETIKNITIAKYLSLKENLSYSQIAKTMKRPLGTVKRWMISDLIFDFNDEVFLAEIKKLLLKKIDDNYVIKKNKVLICLHCGIEYESKYKSKYCSNKCQQEYIFHQKYNAWLNNFDEPSKYLVKKFLIKKDSYKCANPECNLSTWLGKEIMLELEHKDGNGENNIINNVYLLCPNCHSQTPTYKGKNKNKGNGRWKRRQRYAEGKST